MSDSQRTPVTLLGRLRANPTDQEAWTAFVHRYGRLLWRWFRGRFHLQDTDAENLTQEVIVTVAESMGVVDSNRKKFVYHPARRFRGWLFTVARSVFNDWYKSRQQREWLNAQPLESERAEESLTELEREIAAEHERELFEQVCAEVRLQFHESTWRTFELTVLQRVSPKDAAQQQSLTLAAVYQNRKRVREALQKAIAKLRETEDA